MREEGEGPPPKEHYGRLVAFWHKSERNVGVDEWVHPLCFCCRHEPVLLSARDREDIRMAAANQVTYVSVPFVRTAADVLEVGGPTRSSVFFWSALLLSAGMACVIL